jgi:hypothetical protein
MKKDKFSKWLDREIERMERLNQKWNYYVAFKKIRAKYNELNYPNLLLKKKDMKELIT